MAVPMSNAVAGSLAERLIGEHSRRMQRTAPMGKVRRYLTGDHDLPYMPRGAKAEYKELARKSVTNWLPLVVDTFAKRLFVDDYRPSRTSESSPAWAYWQTNGMDARQSILTRGALEYGVAYCAVLPGSPAPVIRPMRATSTIAEYADEDDLWPVHGLRVKGKSVDGARLYELVDSVAVYDIAQPSGSDALRVMGTAEHGLGVTPWVRYRDRLDGEAVGIVAPLITIQDRINEAVFALLIALQYASFRQRWATGLAIPLDDAGNPVEPFAAAVDRLWVTDNPDAKFGDFAQTLVDGHLATYDSAVRTLAAIAQTSPHALMGDLVNLSADALAAAEATTERRGDGFATLFGESHEQMLSLATVAAGGKPDDSAQVRWRDTESRSLAATVDALGKMVATLGVPAEGVWERIPGVTGQDVELWRAAADRADGVTALATALRRQRQPAPPAAAGEAA